MNKRLFCTVEGIPNIACREFDTSSHSAVVWNRWLEQWVQPGLPPLGLQVEERRRKPLRG
ncbi:hypothetical protein M407DRAFT_243214 [Tulasnella calospora MUT 4182]|uniref:Uncharacterized protein n=1 Tax=Tulasnella calospora MUT 4182 TaxID=1051891 RepID=A0A0C3QKN3_9AGAM|nr:hypothetical protein M407DRAFT_243214 [Tulasnella calospora MUT 4182]